MQWNVVFIRMKFSCRLHIETENQSHWVSSLTLLGIYIVYCMGLKTCRTYLYMLNIPYCIDILSSISNYIDFLHLIWLCLLFWQHELSNDVKVMLRQLNIKSSGVYRCEISAEAPNFSSVEGEGRMEIVCKFSYSCWQCYHTHAH